jgi:hypothetical protein
MALSAFLKRVAPCLLAAVLPSLLHAETLFFEAESFESTGDGWQVRSGNEEKAASGLAVLAGAGGKGNAIATKKVTLAAAGHYKVWVRYTSVAKFRGPFRVSVRAGEKELASELFDTAVESTGKRDGLTWGFFEADLPAGEITLQLDKHEKKASSGNSRQIDCFLLTTDPKLVPNHLQYGTQTYLRVTFGPGYEKPVYLHIFADHYHAPWYQHFNLSRAGTNASVAPKGKQDLLHSGESTPWCNISPMLFQDSGAMLQMSARFTYTELAERLKAKLEFATSPDPAAIVRTIEADFQPNYFTVVMPPNLNTPENIAMMMTDREVAEATGKIADAYDWPTWGKKPERFLFSVQAKLAPDRMDAAVLAREKKTLSYFDFNDDRLHRIGGVWMMKNGSFCQPDLLKMTARAAEEAAEFQRKVGDVSKISFCELTDEPTGQKLEFMAQDPEYQAQFRLWLKALGETPASLLVPDEQAIRTVTEKERDQFPALYLFSQRFRTRALGDFMATQRGILEKAYGTTFPVLANFSDGAIYEGNFYAQGVDYFELLDSPTQNAIWGEDWANAASTSQCAAFNVDLMRAAARDRGQIIGHHLIAYAGRKPWDVKLKATSETARGVKMLNNFCYGPSWATHEGGPPWKTSVWYAKPETWRDFAALPREIGAVEDLLLSAKPAPAEVALLYSSTSDAWTIGGNLAYGFDRMHTWIALAHAQVPVDIISEKQAVAGQLDGRRVCYLSGPNLSRAAAEAVKAWVQKGGTLWLTAGAASRDEFNRPLHTLDELLPAERGELQELQKSGAAGRNLRTLASKDVAKWNDGSADVLSVRQALIPRGGARVLASFANGLPAAVTGPAGSGAVYCTGFLPALSYIKTAQDARQALQDKVDQAKAGGAALTAEEQAGAALLERSKNPWAFPADVRRFLLAPVRAAHCTAPIACSAPLVDAVYMTAEPGVLIPLANYTNEPIAKLSLRVQVPRPIMKVESARRGPVAFQQKDAGVVELTLPLENNDFVKLMY